MLFRLNDTPCVFLLSFSTPIPKDASLSDDAQEDFAECLSGQPGP